MRNYANGVVVHLVGVHLLAKHLRRHVSRSATGVECLLGVLGTGYSEISQSEVA
jgi:hypothetical protein